MIASSIVAPRLASRKSRPGVFCGDIHIGQASDGWNNKHPVRCIVVDSPHPLEFWTRKTGGTKDHFGPACEGERQPRISTAWPIERQQPRSFLCLANSKC